MSKKVIAGIVVLVLLVAGLVGGVFLVRQRQELRKEAAPATSLSLTPSQSTIKAGETISLTISMDTAENKATGADLTITYDPKKLVLTEFKPGTFLPIPLSQPKIDNNQGLATAVFGAQPASVPKGKGSLGTLVFQAKETGTVSVAFSPETEVIGADEETNVLVAKNPASVTIQASSVQVGLVPSPAATATPKAGTQATGAAQTASPSASPKATASPKGAAKTTSSPTPTGTPKELPRAGFSLPTLGMFGAGVLILLLGILLAF